MSLKLILEFAVVLGALLMGARAGGVALGLWGAVGLLVLVVGFGVPPGAIPGEVLIIVLTVIRRPRRWKWRAAWTRARPSASSAKIRNR
jgi:hypothetical protein